MLVLCLEVGWVYTNADSLLLKNHSKVYDPLVRNR